MSTSGSYFPRCNNLFSLENFQFPPLRFVWFLISYPLIVDELAFITKLTAVPLKSNMRYPNCLRKRSSNMLIIYRYTGILISLSLRALRVTVSFMFLIYFCTINKTYRNQMSTVRKTILADLDNLRRRAWHRHRWVLCDLSFQAVASLKNLAAPLN